MALKEDIVRKIAISNNATLKDAEDIVDNVFDALHEILENEEKLVIHNFGTFNVKKHKQKVGWNPKKKEKKIVSEYNSVSFVPSSKLKETINKKLRGT